MQKRQFNIRISDECYEQLETLTKKMDTSVRDSHDVVSYWMTQMNYYVAKHMKYEALDRQTFQKMVQENQGLLILKFGATWCEPCKRIEPEIHFSTSS